MPTQHDADHVNSADESPQPGGDAMVLDLLEALRDQVRRAKERAGLTASQSAHAAGLARDIFSHRAEFANALATLGRIDDEGHHDLFLREVGRSYYIKPHRLANADGRADLLTEWIYVLLESLAEVEKVLQSADSYSRLTAEQTEEDRAFRSAVRDKAAERWRVA